MWMSLRYYYTFLNNVLSSELLKSFYIHTTPNLLQDVASEFGVDAMPTFVFFRKGKEVDRLIGANKGELRERITKHRV